MGQFTDHSQKTDREKSDMAYQQEVKAWGKATVERCIGSATDYYRLVWKEGQATNFAKWMNEPEPDWQRDC